MQSHVLNPLHQSQIFSALTLSRRLYPAQPWNVSITSLYALYSLHLRRSNKSMNKLRGAAIRGIDRGDFARSCNASFCSNSYS